MGTSSMKCRLCKRRPPTPKHLTCRRCRYEKEKKDYYRWSFGVHRRNAKRRGIAWDLTLEQFTAFAVEHDLIKKAGIKKRSLHVDRKDPTKGYVDGNIQPLTNRKNVQKMHRDLKVYVHDIQTGEGKFLKFGNFQENDAPF